MSTPPPTPTPPIQPSVSRYTNVLFSLSHRWLTYLLLLILDLLICLTMCLWMAKQSRWLLIT